MEWSSDDGMSTSVEPGMFRQKHVQQMYFPLLSKVNVIKANVYSKNSNIITCIICISVIYFYVTISRVTCLRKELVTKKEKIMKNEA